VQASPGGFLTARWRHIAILSFRAEASQLTPLLPRGVELDLWNGQAFVSVVGLLFEDLSVLGIKVPFYRRFHQLNVRFYVRRMLREGYRRGVVFMRELVPYRTMVLSSRLLYNQKHEFASIRLNAETGGTGSNRQHSCGLSDELPAAVEYRWRQSSRWNRLRVEATASPEIPNAGSLEEFITRRHWGYARARGASLEFEVRRSDWRVSPGSGWLDCDTAGLFGPYLARFLPDQPASALLSPGSLVALSLPTKWNAS
jgi:uncharacterized protein YqjF (DUF2071 family)